MKTESPQSLSLRAQTPREPALCCVLTHNHFGSFICIFLVFRTKNIGILEEKLHIPLEKNILLGIKELKG